VDWVQTRKAEPLAGPGRCMPAIKLRVHLSAHVLPTAAQPSGSAGGGGGGPGARAGVLLAGGEGRCAGGNQALLAACRRQGTPAAPAHATAARRGRQRRAARPATSEARSDGHRRLSGSVGSGAVAGFPTRRQRSTPGARACSQGASPCYLHKVPNRHPTLLGPTTLACKPPLPGAGSLGTPALPRAPVPEMAPAATAVLVKERREPFDLASSCARHRATPRTVCWGTQQLPTRCFLLACARLRPQLIDSHVTFNRVCCSTSAHVPALFDSLPLTPRCRWPRTQSPLHYSPAYGRPWCRGPPPRTRAGTLAPVAPPHRRPA
jgi:hypothetical protein